MPAKLLFQFDSYLKEFEAVVTRIEGNTLFLDQTAFHPRPSGGLDADHGFIYSNSGVPLKVVDVTIVDNDVAHHIEGDPSILRVGEKIRGVIDWDRRYRIMRLHTASHIIAALLYERYGALVTGGHIGPDVARDDFDLSRADDWKAALRWAVEETNRIASKCIEVKVYWLSREEALSIPGLIKLAEKLPPSIDKLRVVEIPGVDIQADGGPHVRNTCEIGEIEIVKLESKGRKKRRIYYKLKEGETKG
ncbi:MAG: alanyl-tRNA editing protein [Desulfurococcales archaeon]|nr:alanyl-tRNA editing protein [Desulfurococcales archaeon]